MRHEFNNEKPVFNIAVCDGPAAKTVQRQEHSENDVES